MTFGEPTSPSFPTAIPTRYAGTEFRSRLEATWAAFFDLLGWTWEYEPIDLPGWIPDFILTGPAGRVLVEVKPADSLNGYDIPKIHAGSSADTEKREVLLLGRSPMIIPRGPCFGEPCIGWLTGYSKWWPTELADPHEAMWTVDEVGRTDFTSDVHDYAGRLNGAHLESPLVTHGLTWWRGPHRFAIDIKRMWTEAGNTTRWNRPKVFREGRA